ncbi:hypothetical protein EUX98_g9217 [Antrodiella citrinella]|uniref:Uncharacterized protein n=1 Tax=Antrodiella citrinella TaxID=2447956 RepID=A0A4S4LWI8_9APHY|nr:hypothetical protein EUX98_g9217 [Antrodiella citrinella]
MMSAERVVAIIAACRADAATRRRNTGCIPVGSMYVKYGESEAMVSQIETRSHFSTAQGGADKPRIPELISHFDDGEGTTYVVMTLIKLVESPPDLDTRRADAIKWLATVPAPPGHLLGPLGGGCIRHRFFAEWEAPEPYVSVQALKRYLDKGRRRSYKHRKGFKRTAVTDEKLIFTQTDADSSHFGVDEHGKTVIMGVGSISYLPESFARYAIMGDDKVGNVPDALSWAGADQMYTMVRISGNPWPGCKRRSREGT